MFQKLSFLLILFLFTNLVCGQNKKALEKEETMTPATWLSIFDAKNSTGIKADSLRFGELPPELDYRGIIVEAVKWSDSSGAHILLLTQTGAFLTKETGENNDKAEVYAYLYSKSNTENNFARKWKLYDFVTCFGVDMYAGFYARSLTITDVNKDGYAEITFIYKLSCRGGMGPAPQKLILYEKDQKYAMRGETFMAGGDPKITKENNYKADEKLKANKELFQLAKKRWATIGEDDYKQFRND